MEYWIRGNTYHIKEDLKAHGCLWDAKEKAWKTPWLDKDELSYKMIKSLTEAADADLIPTKLSPEFQRIQDILKKENL